MNRRNRKPSKGSFRFTLLILLSLCCASSLACPECSMGTDNAPVSNVPGVGFALTTEYGTASVYYPNGTVAHIAKIDGGPAYKAFMRRAYNTAYEYPPTLSNTEPPSPPPEPPSHYYPTTNTNTTPSFSCTFFHHFQTLFPPFRLLFPRLCRPPASPSPRSPPDPTSPTPSDIAALTPLLALLKRAAELHLGVPSPLCHALIAGPRNSYSSAAEADRATVHAALRRVGLRDEHPQPAENMISVATPAAAGMLDLDALGCGIGGDGVGVVVVVEVVRGGTAVVTVMEVEDGVFERWEERLVVEVGEEGEGEGEGEAGGGAPARYSGRRGLEAAVRKVVEYVPEGQRVDRVVVHGDGVRMRGVREALVRGLGEERLVAEALDGPEDDGPGAAVDPVFAASSGVAKFAYEWTQELWGEHTDAASRCKSKSDLYEDKWWREL